MGQSLEFGAEVDWLPWFWSGVGIRSGSSSEPSVCLVEPLGVDVLGKAPSADVLGKAPGVDTLGVPATAKYCKERLSIKYVKKDCYSNM